MRKEKIPTTWMDIVWIGLWIAVFLSLTVVVFMILRGDGGRHDPSIPRSSGQLTP